MRSHELEPQNLVLQRRSVRKGHWKASALRRLPSCCWRRQSASFSGAAFGHPKIRVARCAASRKRAPDRAIEIIAANVRSDPAGVRPQSPRLRDLLRAGSVGARTGKRGRKCVVDAEGHGRRNEGRRRFGRAAGKESLGFSCPPQWRIKEWLRLADQCATDCVGNSGMRASADGEASGSRFSILPGPLPARREFSRRAESTAPSCGHRRGIPPRSSPNGCTLRIRALRTASRTWPSTWRASPRFQRRR